MRTAPSARRAPLPGPRTYGVMMAGLSLLTLLHPTAADAAKPKRRTHAVQRAYKRSGYVAGGMYWVSVRPARKHSQKRAVARYHDPEKFLIPQGDGSPVLSRAANYLGRPYRFGSEGDAFDCSGFVRTVFADVGIELPHSAREIATLGDRVARDELEPGDLVFFHDAGQHYATHVGIYVGDDKFVHAARRAGQVQVDSLSETYYTQHYFGARRIEV